MSEVLGESYKVNTRSGVVHLAIAGRLTERCNGDDAKHLIEVQTIEAIGSVTRRKVRFCQWCARDLVP